jgi:hypothetical protein
MGYCAAAPSRFCCESSFDVVVYRLDYDAPRFAFGVAFQLARVDEFVQLFARDLDRPHRLLRRSYERDVKPDRNSVRHMNFLLFADVSEHARLDFRRKALRGPRALFGCPVVRLSALFGPQPRSLFGRLPRLLG